MNYMAHLKGYQIERGKTPLSTNAIALYFILMEYNNGLDWIKWFTVPNSTLQGLTGLEIKSLQRTRNELIQKKYVEYKKGSGNQAGSYLIVRFDLQRDQQSDQQRDQQSDQQSDLQDDRQMSNNATTLYKPNETKPNHKSNTNVLPKEPRPRFRKPTVEEIAAYCKERGNSIDPNRFYDYYESNGWMVGKTKIKDWKSAVRTWETNQYGKTNKPTEQRKYTDTSYDISELEQSLFRRDLEA